MKTEKFPFLFLNNFLNVLGNGILEIYSNYQRESESLEFGNIVHGSVDQV